MKPIAEDEVSSNFAMYIRSLYFVYICNVYFNAVR